MSNSRFLVTGGAGYIGSHLVSALVQRGSEVHILDDFSTGHRWATQDQPVTEVDLKNLDALRAALRGQAFDGVFHFAAKSLVGESNKQPRLYWQNNVVGTSNLIQVAVENRWNRCVFSSTAAVYGNPKTERINESHAQNPVNVYGQTKLSMERMLQGVCDAGEFSAICLRYFNAAGAAADGRIGEAHEPETHLIPNALRAASGRGPALTIFGNDYPTADGTCVRDYIHVEDLVDAHLLAMDYLGDFSGFDAMNLGNGNGFSVQAVFGECEEVVGHAIPHSIGERRDGDPPTLVADATKARRELGWAPAYTELGTIVESAWKWEQRRPQ